MIKPLKLNPGDKIGLTCPGDRPYHPSQIVRALKLIELAGFEAVLGQNILKSDGYLAGSDQERAYDLNVFFKSADIKAIMFLTGGYGSLRLLPYLNYQSLKLNPKIILGSKENTALILAIQKMTNLVVFYGPQILEIQHKSQLENLVRFLMDKELKYSIKAGHELLQDSSEKYFYKMDFKSDLTKTNVTNLLSGKNIRAVLYGGNLSSLVSLMGSDYMIDLNDSIMFLDDENERTDILDRQFTSLYLGGHLQNIKGLLFGEFKNCNSKNSPNLFSVEELFEDYIRELSIPSCFNFNFIQVMPIGIKAELNFYNGELTFREKHFL